MCRKKDPPVDTPLEPGINIGPNKYKKGDLVCYDCYNERQRRYKSEKYAEYKEQKHQETIEELTEQWNDPAFKDLKEISDRVYRVWNKYDRRLPSKGVRRDWACEVVFADLWFIDANGIVEVYFAEHPMSRSKRLSIKNDLIQFVSSNLEHERLYFREKARNRWTGIIGAITKNYHGKDKLVATPKYVDPVTKEFIPNYYLLTEEKQRFEREKERDARIESYKMKTEEEKIMIKYREEIKRREKAKHAKEPKKNMHEDTTDNDNINEGGE